MKDIKQYFSNDTRIIDERNTADFDNATEQKEEKQWETTATGKRKRVKIRISRTSKERMCDIVDSKNDLIDKTPSPFNDKINSEKIMHDETPKTRRSERNLKKV